MPKSSTVPREDWDRLREAALKVAAFLDHHSVRFLSKNHPAVARPMHDAADDLRAAAGVELPRASQLRRLLIDLHKRTEDRGQREVGVGSIWEQIRTLQRELDELETAK
jgi:hypothetical protein